MFDKDQITGYDVLFIFKRSLITIYTEMFSYVMKTKWNIVNIRWIIQLYVMYNVWRSQNIKKAWHDYYIRTQLIAISITLV